MRRLVATAVLTGAALAAAAPATAAPVAREEVDVLQLRSTVDPDALSRLSPGQHVHWTIDADLRGAPEGDLSLRLLAAGEMVDHAKGLVVSLVGCAEAWDGVEGGLHEPDDHLAACPARPREVLAPQPLRDVPQMVAFPHRRITPTSGEHLLLTLWLPEDAPEELQGARSTIGLGVTAVGEELDPVPVPTPTPGSPGSPGTPPAPGTPGAPTTPVPGGSRGPGGGAGTAVPVGTGTGGDAGTSGPESGPARWGGSSTSGVAASLPDRLARTGLDALPALAVAGAAVAGGLLLGRLARTSTRRRTS